MFGESSLIALGFALLRRRVETKLVNPSRSGSGWKILRGLDLVTGSIKGCKTKNVAKGSSVYSKLQYKSPGMATKWFAVFLTSRFLVFSCYSRSKVQGRI